MTVSVALVVIVALLMVELRKRQFEWGCLFCGGKREHHPKCPRKGDE